jgi:hypothetical protein
MFYKKIPTSFLFIALYNLCIAQNVPILSYDTNNFGQVELEIEAQADKYYVLTAQHEPGIPYESVTSITMGVDGNLIISEPAGAYPLQNYTITEHDIANPDDQDGDGIDDITEFNDMPTNAPLNFAEAISFTDGTTSIPDAATFASLAVVEDVPWAPFLNGQQFVKFGILDKDTDEPKVYFINSNTHFIHAGFFNAIGANVNGDDGSGEIVFNPNEILPNGSIGSYSFNFSFGDAESFESTRRSFELLVANMPFLNNNMQHFIGDGGEGIYTSQYEADYAGSRVNVVLESEVFADIDYIPLNQAEGYGFFKHMALNETPGSRDIVLYDALPNSLPRVGGIITSIIQTPLSHVNLRAIQDNVPNAYIQDPLAIDSIANLLDNYIYYKVEQDRYYIREATIDEVNDWYEALRPTEEQIPERDLSQTEILPLDSITFEMSTSFGAKCSNVATMRNFGFPEGTIPDGFGIPFYFYDEFMKFNDFYTRVEDMINDPDFIGDLQTRIDMLDDFRDDIKDAPLPQWMLDELQDMQESFPIGTSIRCRSSTNNEDLPGFSGAGLYTSKTQHPWEGHIQKSVKQVYASMWNFRAFDERDFYRVDHFIAAMGILCHPNFEEEKSNGVGVSIDPIYMTQNNFYLNTQVGESLITNPDANSIPEEMLLSQDPDQGYFILRYSNLVDGDEELVMEEIYLDQMREYLGVIHDEFAILYNVVGAEGFGMDIEYKVTAEDQLIIKQARPWVSFWADIKANRDLAAVELTNPQNTASLSDSELVSARIRNAGLEEMSNFDIQLLINDVLVETLNIDETLTPQSEEEYEFATPQDFSAIGDYDVKIVVAESTDGYSANDTLSTVLTKLHLLEGELTIEKAEAVCGETIEVSAKVKNYGETTFNNTEIEVIANGMVVDVVNYTSNIVYTAEAEINISVTENLQQGDNEITLNLLSLNGQPDAINSNNNASVVADLSESDYDYVTLVINADDYPQETSWEVYDELNNEVVATGFLEAGAVGVTEDICVDYSSCLSLRVYDSWGDGICCGFGQGDFSMLNSAGETLFTNDGEFDFEAIELFCPNEEGCQFNTEIETINATDEDTADGVITITATSGFAPYAYSIDGGLTFFENNTFADLTTGEYEIMVQDASETCFYQETITLEFGVINNVNEVAASDIKVFPNPTNGMLTIEIDEAFPIAGDVQIEIYDYLGRMIESDVLSRLGNESKTVISLEEYASGSYFAKCYNEGFERYFKVVKL